MSLQLRTEMGCTEAVLDDTGNLHRFHHIADILTRDLQVQFTSKEDEVESLNWDFSFGRHLLTLCYDIYNGISLFPTRLIKAAKAENEAVVQLASVLQGKLMNAKKSL